MEKTWLHISVPVIQDAPRTGRTGTEQHSLFLPWVGDPAPAPEPVQHAQEVSPEEQQMADAINSVRQEHNLPALAINTQLCRAARAHSLDMMQRGYFDHDTLDGPSVFERIRQYYQGGAVGECIAAGYKAAEYAVRAWIQSDGHRAIILEDQGMPYKWTVMGLGYAHGGKYDHYYVSVFGN